jgi:hypothetical protein
MQRPSSKGSHVVERRLLCCVAWWLLITAAWGFGGVAPHLPPFSQRAAVIQTHAIGLSIWTILVVIQCHLALARRRRLHAVVGTVAIASLTAGVVTGCMTVVRAVELDRRTLGEGLLLLGPLLLGAVLVLTGMLARRDGRWRHGQAILLATTLFTTLAVDRIGFLLGLHAIPVLVACLRLAPVAAIAWLELRRRGRVSWSVLAAGAVLLALDVESLVASE